MLNKARADKLDFNLLLTRYALERMLYRLSISEQRGQFLLKGARLFDIWFDMPHRPTHDADLLGFGSTETPHLEKLFREVSQIASDDGIAFQAGLPFGLSDEFALHEQKSMQWAGFQRKNALQPTTLVMVAEALREFLMPVLMALAANRNFNRQWRAGVGWDDGV